MGNKFMVRRSKAALEEEREQNQEWWDKWDAGERGSTYLYVPTVVRVIEPGDPRIPEWRKTTPQLHGM